MTLARGFHLERMAGGICRAIKFHEQRVIETLRRHIFDGDRFDCFRDIQRGVLLNENFSGEFLNFELPRCRRRRKHSDYRGKESRGAKQTLPAASMIPGFCGAGVTKRCRAAENLRPAT